MQEMRVGKTHSPAPLVSTGSWKKQESSRETSISALLTMPKPLTAWITINCGKFSVVVGHGLSNSAACGIFPDQRWNPRPMHWQVESQPLDHQGSPPRSFESGPCCQSADFKTGRLSWTIQVDQCHHYACASVALAGAESHGPS